MATFVWVPDEAPTIENKPRVLTTQMGDGYEQRIAFGLQTQPVTLSVAFTERTPGEIEAIDNFLRDHAGVVAFDYSPQWRTRRNLLIQSEDLAAADWIKSAATISSNIAVSPYGATTVDRLVENTANSPHSIYQARTGTNETTTFSIYLSAAGRTRLYLQMSNLVNSVGQAILDLSTGTVVSTVAGGSDYSNVSASVLELSSGLRRFSLTTTKAAVNTNNAPVIGLISSGTTTTYTGDGVSGVNIWGAMLNIGTTALEYEAVGPVWAPAEVGKYVCQEWTRSPRNCAMHTLTATFREVFDQ